MSMMQLRQAEIMPDGLLGELGQENITTNEITSEMINRGYIKYIPPAPSPGITTIAPSPVARLTRVECIRKGVDYALQEYGYTAKCMTPGGCFLDAGRYDLIVTRATSLANLYYQLGYVPGESPAASTYVASPVYNYSPSPVYSPSPATQIIYSPGYPSPVAPSSPTGATILPLTLPSTYISRSASPSYSPGYTPSQYFQGLGQAATQPAMSTDEKISFGLSILANIANTASDFYSARAERARLAAMGQQIPSLTAAEVEAILARYKILNPAADQATISQVGAGLFGQQQPATDYGKYLVPGLIAVGVVGIMMAGRRR